MATRTKKPPQVRLLCPSCRSVQPAKPVGTATIARRRREVVQCLAKDCELTWLPSRQHVPAAPAAA